MKKKALIFSIFASVLALSGCGIIKTSTSNENTVTCSRDRMNLGINYKQEVIGTLKNDKIESAEVKLSFDTETEAREFCLALENPKFHCDKKTITASNYEDIEDDIVIGLTKEEFINKFTKDGLTCK